MSDMVFLHGSIPVVKTLDVFSVFGYSEHRALKKLISDNKKVFEKHGILSFKAFENASNRKKGGQEKSYLLNEQQFILLVMLAKNTSESIEIKQRVVADFFRMREELARVVSTPSAYIDKVRDILLLDAPSEWVKLYPNEYYIALMQLYGKQFTSNRHTPPYCGAITKRWIYDVVLPPELNNEIDAQRKEERKHSWFKDKGRDILLKQIMDVTGIARQSRDRVEFEARCGSLFNNEPFQLMLMI